MTASMFLKRAITRATPLPCAPQRLSNRPEAYPAPGRLVRWHGLSCDIQELTTFELRGLPQRIGLSKGSGSTPKRLRKRVELRSSGLQHLDNDLAQ